MQRTFSVIAVLIAALSAMPVSAPAGETVELRVTATVIGNCKILSVQDISFGSLDPGQALNTRAEGSLTFACTRGVDYRLTADRGENFDAAGNRRRMRASSGALLPYALESESVSGIGQGFSSPTSFVLAAAISGADYRDLPVDDYADTLRLTLEP